MHAIFQNLMAAVISNDREQFVADCNDAMREAITPDKLETVSKQIEPRTQDGYKTDYFGELRRGGYTVHHWRLRFKDGKNDLLAVLSLKDGKVGGFFLR